MNKGRRRRGRRQSNEMRVGGGLGKHINYDEDRLWVSFRFIFFFINIINNCDNFLFIEGNHFNMLHNFDQIYLSPCVCERERRGQELIVCVLCSIVNNFTGYYPLFLSSVSYPHTPIYTHTHTTVNIIVMVNHVNRSLMITFFYWFVSSLFQFVFFFVVWVTLGRIYGNIFALLFILFLLFLSPPPPPLPPSTGNNHDVCFCVSFDSSTTPLSLCFHVFPVPLTHPLKNKTLSLYYFIMATNWTDQYMFFIVMYDVHG